MQITKNKSMIAGVDFESADDAKAKGNAVFAMIEMHLPMVRNIARNSYRQACEDVEYDDLFSAALMGLIGAIEDFDISVDGNFEKYCKVRIKTAVKDCLRIVVCARDEA